MTTTSQAPTPDALREMRVAAGLTQRELAGHAGCSLAWIANAEGGYIPARSETLDRVLSVLNDERRSPQSAAVQTSAEQGRHGQV